MDDRYFQIVDRCLLDWDVMQLFPAHRRTSTRRKPTLLPRGCRVADANPTCSNACTKCLLLHSENLRRSGMRARKRRSGFGQKSRHKRKASRRGEKCVLRGELDSPSLLCASAKSPCNSVTPCYIIGTETNHRRRYTPMKITILDGAVENPGDLSWDEFAALVI